MSDIQPGDLVVCVDNAPRRTSGLKNRHDLTLIKIGGIYRVSAVGFSKSTDGVVMPRVTLAGVRGCSPGGGFWLYRFRKLNDEADNAAIVALIKRPIRKPVEA